MSKELNMIIENRNDRNKSNSIFDNEIIRQNPELWGKLIWRI
ncbi:MAG: hypothetical protein Q8S24_03665 [Eubacteriales bacterium]|nr:hypothetical protein [Eubacteriales bacterium]